jgi:hypothetical protein
MEQVAMGEGLAQAGESPYRLRICERSIHVRRVHYNDRSLARGPSRSLLLPCIEGIPQPGRVDHE